MKIKFKDYSGIERVKEPVSFGVPFSAGVLNRADEISLVNEMGDFIPFGYKILGKWHDDSIKWLLFDIQVSVSANNTTTIELVENRERIDQGVSSAFTINKHGDTIAVPAGDVEFVMNTQGYFRPFNLAGDLSKITLTDGSGNLWHPFIDFWDIEHDTLMKKTLCFSGVFRNEHHSHSMQFVCRTHFFSGKSYSKTEFTIINPNAAQHPGGAWDLGDEHSMYFKDLSFNFNIDRFEEPKVIYTPNLRDASQSFDESSQICIYQDSSGNENWRSKNHINRDGEVPLSFKGYKIYEDDKIIGDGLKASPFIAVWGKQNSIYCYMDNFWQNFPKALEASKNSLTIKLFPEQFNDLFELQPGEQKTHTFYLGFDKNIKDKNPVKWVTDPLLPDINCEFYYKGFLRPRPVPNGNSLMFEGSVEYEKIINGFIEGKNSYKKKNDIIDEYGWRNFGDIYADHEAVFNKEGNEFISHYNNQYDVIKGAVFQYIRTGNRKWYEFAVNLADHVSDIDIYHTDNDKYQYNHGLFWHTDHHLDAHTCTHRTISIAHKKLKPAGAFGGGPYLEHNYATGLLYLYWMTGNERYKNAVLEMSSFIVNWMEGPDTICEFCFQTLRDGIRKIKNTMGQEKIRIYVFDGPCRASGNSLNTLLDAYYLTHDSKYIKFAELLITMAVHPNDDPDAMDMLNAEIRWFYTVFLQALGRYLDIKRSENNQDTAFHFGRQVLINYAKWMAENEYPYLEKPEILEFPNETWAAQDIRKADIFAIAAYYAPSNLRPLFIEKSKFFFEHSVKELDSFDTKFLSRPMVLIMTNGMPYMEMIYDKNDQYDGDAERENMEAFNTTKRVLIKKIWKNLKYFSISKELNWISRQLKSRTGK